MLAGAGAGAVALLLEQNGLEAQAPAGSTVVFPHTTVVTVDAVRDDVALAVQGDMVAAIGPTDEILRTYPRADVYDGRGKALFPGLINCHAHMDAVLARGFNEDFGFPNSATLAIQPASLLRGEEGTPMVTVAALEAIRTGTTTIVQNAGGIARSAVVLAIVRPEGFHLGVECPSFTVLYNSQGVPDEYGCQTAHRAGRNRVCPWLCLCRHRARAVSDATGLLTRDDGSGTARCRCDAQLRERIADRQVDHVTVAGQVGLTR